MGTLKEAGPGALSSDDDAAHQRQQHEYNLCNTEELKENSANKNKLTLR